VKKPRAHVKKATRKVVAPAPEKPVHVKSQPVVTAQVVAAPEPVAPKARPRRQKPAKTVVVADPPHVVAPEPVDVVSTTPVPPEPTPDGTTTTPPVPCTSAAGCPPPRPPVLTCRTCGIVAPVPPPRRPLRIVAPGSADTTP
jgi:hypothetical protein